MYQIIEYNPKYNQKINDFVISIYIEEYGFKEHREIIKNTDNSAFVKSGGNFWIALEEDEIVGTIAVWKHDKENIEIKRLYVKKEYRGTGLARTLYEKAIEYCEKNSFKRIFLGTYDKLETAIYFYLKKGFQEIKGKETKNGEKFFELYI